MKYKFQRTPYAHQKRALRKLASSPGGYGGALLMEPRTGKTKVAVDFGAMLHQAKGVTRVLIICPNSVMGVWEREIKANLPRELTRHIIVWDREGRKATPQLERHSGLVWVIVNFDAFSVPGKKLKSGRRSRASGRWKFYNTIARWKPELVIVDEAHRMKNPQSKRAKMIHKFHDTAPHRVLLTGTPVTGDNKVFDVYSQWRFLNRARFKELGTFKEFKHEYGEWTDVRGFPELKKDRKTKKPILKNLDDLRARVHADSFAITRTEAFPHLKRLPPQVVPVRLDPRARRIYNELAEDMIAEVREGLITEASIRLVLTTRLSQITSGFARTTDGHLEDVGDEKLRVLRDLVSDAAENDEKLVVAARFKRDINRIYALIVDDLKLPTWLIDGDVPRTKRDLSIEAFNAIDDPAVMIIQPQAAGLGIDLSSASTMIWYSLTTSFVDYSQACDRIALSEKPTSTMHLLARASIDEVMYQSLLDDDDIVRLILSRPESLLMGCLEETA